MAIIVLPWMYDCGVRRLDAVQHAGKSSATFGRPLDLPIRCPLLISRALMLYVLYVSARTGTRCTLTAE